MSCYSVYLNIFYCWKKAGRNKTLCNALLNVQLISFTMGDYFPETARTIVFDLLCSLLKA